MNPFLATLIVLILMLFGTPVFVVIAGLAIYLFFTSQIDISAMIIEMHRMATTPILVAIPLFTFAGYLLSESGAPRRLIRLSDAILGWLPGGLRSRRSRLQIRWRVWRWDIPRSARVAEHGECRAWYRW